MPLSWHHVREILGMGASVDPFIPLPRWKEKLAERILSPEQVRRMIELTEQERDRVLIRFLYGTGVRVSEVTALKVA